jgi:O-Antigen ligase/Tetratricopeptide repeat
MTTAPARVLPRVGADDRARQVRWDDARAALLGGLALAPLAAVNGGYWPTAWNWSVLIFLWVAALALVLRAASIGRMEVVMLGAFLVWVGASSIWSSDVGQTVLETQRGLVVFAALAAVLLLVRGSSYRALLVGVWAGIAIVCGYALLTRLFPERLGVYDPIAGYRLAEPLGYWNALGIFAAVGSLLALGLAAHGQGYLLRAVAAASLLLTIPTLYFTFSRGAWIALGGGLIAALAVETRRLTLATTLLVVAPFAALAVWRASEFRGLTRLDSPLALASHDGHRLTFLLVLLAAGAALAVTVVAALTGGLSFSLPARRAYGVILALGLVACTLAIFAHYGSPATLAREGYHSFASSSPAASTNLNRRLFTLASPRKTIWHTAWRDVEAHPLVGSGAGTFERFWLQHRTSGGKVRDAHSLYLETLAELGPVGLLLLVVVLAMPVVAAIRVRRRRLVPLALAAYAAFLLHAGVDWDWEVPAVALAGLFCGASILLAARSSAGRFRLSVTARGTGVVVAVLLGAYALIGLLGNRALSAANAAADARRPAKEESHARDAMRWAPWSSEAQRLLAESQYDRGNLAAARRTLRDALSQDPQDWELWFNLAAASRGAERAAALRRAHELNPLSPELQDYESWLRGRS